MTLSAPMTNEDKIDDELAERAKGWLDKPERRKALVALLGMLDAVVRERGSTTTRAKPSSKRRRRSSPARRASWKGFSCAETVGFTLDKPRASDPEVERVLRQDRGRPRRTWEPQRRRVRQMAMRAAVCCRDGSLALPPKQLFEAANGRRAAPATQ
jgi:hypothetical protein